VKGGARNAENAGVGAGLRVPESHGVVPTAGGQQAAIRTERHAPDFVVMFAGQGFHRFVRSQRSGVPYLNGPIHTG
jgi:hypothetical protein